MRNTSTKRLLLPFISQTMGAACLTLLLSGCAALPGPSGGKEEKTPTAESPKPADHATDEAQDGQLAQDQAAILGMVGEYEVSFSFEETVVLQAGYERAKPQDSGAFETVLVVEDSPRRVVLQHLLVSANGEHVTKHWRQDWTYEAPTRFEFSEDLTWRTRPLPPQTTQARWTQCVYEVNDAPRYCGTGRWEHRDGVSTWISDPSWRPLPRREYTTRSDYNALRVENRHTVTPGGWTHEQDNTKIRRDGEAEAAALVREFGFNDYRRIEGFDFGPAYRYWEATQDYWARVRSHWQQHFADHDGVRLKTGIDGMALIIPLFELAASQAQGETVSDAQIAAAFDRWVIAPGPQGAAPEQLPPMAQLVH